MAIELKAKKEIQRLVGIQSELTGSSNKYAVKAGVSPATLTNLKNGNWEALSEEMWQRLANFCGYKADTWVTVETRNSKLINALLNDAKTFRESYAWVSPAGSGKTQTCKNFVQAYPSNAVMLECEEHWTKKEFLTKFYQGMGFQAYGLGVGGLMENIQLAASKSTTPYIVVLDEIDKLRDELLYFFISLYNRLNGKAGFFLCATPYLKKRILDGMRQNKKGYAEFFSRIGGKFIEAEAANSMDVVMICKANGVTTEKEIEEIVRDYNQDLRRVQRLINAKNRKRNKGNQSDNEEQKQAA